MFGCAWRSDVQEGCLEDNGLEVGGGDELSEGSASVTVRLLGKPQIEIGGTRKAGLSDKALILLALLAVEFDGSATRRQLEHWLWEDAPPQNASSNLRWLVSAIGRWGRANGATLLDSSYRLIKLDRRLAVDVGRLRGASWGEAGADAQELLDLYRGPFLAGLDEDTRPELTALIRWHRGALQERFLDCVLAMAGRLEGDIGDSLLRSAQRWAPTDERLARAMLLHVYRQKGPKAVETEYALLRARLQTELGAAPERSTAVLAAQLLPSLASIIGPDEPGLVDLANRDIPRLALLPPVAPLGAPPRAIALAEALIDDVVLRLCRERSFTLYAPHTVRQIVGAAARDAAPLAATFLGSTRLLPAGRGGHRLTLALTYIPTGEILLGEQFPFEEGELEYRSLELAALIARKVATAVRSAEMAAYRNSGTGSAYIHALLGARNTRPFDLRALRRARAHFAQALALAPNYVPALTGLARTLTKERLALRRSEPELVQQASAIAERASIIDPEDPEGWREQAQARLYLYDIDGSLALVDQAVTRARHHADILAEKADILTHASRSDEAKTTIEEALRLNPMPPDWYWWVLGTADYFLGHYAAATQSLLRIRTIPGASRLTAAAAAMAGDTETATRYRRRWLELYPDSRVADIPKFMPHANRQDMRHFMHGVRRAGFP
jgi:DNA-binding SARP family transcriptional activator